MDADLNNVGSPAAESEPTIEQRLLMAQEHANMMAALLARIVDAIGTQVTVQKRALDERVHLHVTSLADGSFRIWTTRPESQGIVLASEVPPLPGKGAP